MIHKREIDNTTITNIEDNSIIIADTSALLVNGTGLLKSLKNCHLVIPTVVLKELDNKRNSKQNNIGFLARQWLRFLLEISEENSELKKIELKGYDNITLSIEPNNSNQSVLPYYLQDGSADSTILAVAFNYNKQISDDDNVILLTNDEPLNLHARLLGLTSLSYNYQTPQRIYDGRYKINLTKEESSEYYSQGIDFTKKLILSKLPEKHADYSLLEVDTGINKNNKDSIISFIYDKVDNSLMEIKDKTSDWYLYGLKCANIEQYVASKYLLKSPNSLPLVSLHGGAGSGKTLIALASGIDCVLSDKKKNYDYEKVIVFRSLHEMGEGQEMGFLPGDVDEKMQPYATAIYDALSVLAKNKINNNRKGRNHTSDSQIEKTMENIKAVVDVQPITYLRGRSINNAYIIVDEAQNLSAVELLNVLSRVGKNTKIVLTFDDTQVDNKFLKTGKNAQIWSVIQSLLDKDGIFAHISFKETQRSKLAEIASKLLEEMVGGN